ncbi:MAG: hypothetical protein MZU95_01345 [Desulfomicrobium escambiense]|nr:hypothetical protein [Desulfomicrobium escambiense]
MTCSPFTAIRPARKLSSPRSTGILSTKSAWRALSSNDAAAAVSTGPIWNVL